MVLKGVNWVHNTAMQIGSGHMVLKGVNWSYGLERSQLGTQ